MSSFAAAAATKRLLSHVLTSPSKVAHTLDWRKAMGGRVLSMSIGKDNIDLAVASHPAQALSQQQQAQLLPHHQSPSSLSSSSSSDDRINPLAAPSSSSSNNNNNNNSGLLCQQLPSIPTVTQATRTSRSLSPAVSEELAGIMQDWNVCAVVVSWPVQKEGWVGAPAGRVLFTLDQLLASTSKVVGNRAICLWNDTHQDFHEDEWGRASVYSCASDKKVHYASQEQYGDDRKSVAMDVWNDFCRAHWPELCKSCASTTNTTTSTSSSSSLDCPSEFMWAHEDAEDLHAVASSMRYSATVDPSYWLDSYDETPAFRTKAAL